MERKIKAATATNKVKAQKEAPEDVVKEAMPGTNIHSSTGANPLWNPDEMELKAKPMNPLFQNTRNEEFNDDSDGDDVFIGVEDTEDFRGYKDRYDVISNQKSLPKAFISLFIYRKLRLQVTFLQSVELLTLFTGMVWTKKIILKVNFDFDE